MNFCPESQTPALLPEVLAFFVQYNFRRLQKRKITKTYPALVDNMLLLLRLFIFCGNHFWERGWNVSCEFARSCFSLKRLRSALQSICSGQQSKNSIICFWKHHLPTLSIENLTIFTKWLHLDESAMQKISKAGINCFNCPRARALLSLQPLRLKYHLRFSIRSTITTPLFTLSPPGKVTDNGFRKNNEYPQKWLCFSKLLPVRIFVKREYLCEYKKIFVSKVGWAKQGIRKDAHTHCVETILEILGRFLVFPTIKFISFSILFFVKNFHTTVFWKQKIIQVHFKILRNAFQNKTLQSISTKPCFLRNRVVFNQNREKKSFLQNIYETAINAESAWRKWLKMLHNRQITIRDPETSILAFSSPIPAAPWLIPLNLSPQIWRGKKHKKRSQGLVVSRHHGNVIAVS